MQNVLNRFYNERTMTIFITEQSAPVTTRSSLQPLEILGEMIRIESKQAAVTYIIDNNITRYTGQSRLFNIFFVDSYESFRSVKYSVCVCVLCSTRYFN